MIRYSLSDFAEVPVVYADNTAIQESLDEIPDIASFGADVHWQDDLVELWETEEPRDRSSALMEAAYLAAESKWGDPQILSLLYALWRRPFVKKSKFSKN